MHLHLSQQRRRILFTQSLLRGPRSQSVFVVFADSLVGDLLARHVTCNLCGFRSSLAWRASLLLFTAGYYLIAAMPPSFLIYNLRRHTYYHNEKTTHSSPPRIKGGEQICQDVSALAQNRLFVRHFLPTLPFSLKTYHFLDFPSTF